LAAFTEQPFEYTEGLEDICFTRSVGPEKRHAGDKSLFGSGFDEWNDFQPLVAIGGFSLAVGKVQLEF